MKQAISTILIAHEFNTTSYQGWNFDINYQSSLQCKDQIVYGAFQGTNFVLTKLFAIDIPHQLVDIQFNFIKPKDVDLYMFLNDELFQDLDNNSTGQFCDENTTLFNIHYTQIHSGKTLAITIQVESSYQIPQQNAKWAISDLQIHIEECPSECLICEYYSNGITCTQWKLHSESWVTRYKNQLGMDGWSSMNGFGSSNCANLPIIGGFGKFGAKEELRKIIKLKPHYRLRITFLWVKIDSWDNEAAILYIDGRQIWKWSFQNYVNHGGNICGNKQGNYSTQFKIMDIIAQHTGNQAEIRFTTTLDQGATDESFGLRGLQIFYVPCHLGCDQCLGSEMKDCLICSKGYLLENQQCYSQNGEAFHLLTKEFFDLKFSDLNEWEISGVSNGKNVSLCQDRSIIGGYNVFGQGAIIQKYFFIPPHSKLRFMLVFYIIDRLDDSEFLITIDDQIVWNSTVYQLDDSNLCGSETYKDEKRYIDVTIDHSQQYSILKFNSTLDSNSIQEYWGFRELIILYEATPVVVVEDSSYLNQFYTIYYLILITLIQLDQIL